MKYNNDNPYLDDAVPCVQCGELPTERIGKALPFYICNIPVDGGYGTVLSCKCGRRTNARTQPWEAYIDWNEMNGVNIR